MQQQAAALVAVDMEHLRVTEALVTLQAQVPHKAAQAVAVPLGRQVEQVAVVGLLRQAATAQRPVLVAMVVQARLPPFLAAALLMLVAVAAAQQLTLLLLGKAALAAEATVI